MSNSKYYDGSEKDREPKKRTTRDTGSKMAKGGGVLLGLVLLVKSFIGISKKVKNKA